MYIPEILEEELLDDEKVLWTGMPDPKSSAISALPVLLFAIPWTLFSLFWEGAALAAVISSKGNKGLELFTIVFPLFGVPFVLIGFAMLLSPYFAYLKAKTAVYAVTDKRVMTIYGGKRKNVEADRWESIISIEKNSGTNGMGSINFITNIISNESNKKHSFVGIYDCDEVEKLYYSIKEGKNN